MLHIKYLLLVTLSPNLAVFGVCALLLAAVDELLIHLFGCMCRY